MTKHISDSRTVAFLATVVLFLGLVFSPASAKTIKSGITSKTKQMNVPDFAYPKTVEKNASKTLQTAVEHGDWPAAVMATIQMVTADNIVSHSNATKGISKIDSVTQIAPSNWRPAFLLIKADLYSSIYGSIRWKADSRKLPVDSIPDNPYEWSRDIFSSKVLEICDSILNSSSKETYSLKEWSKIIENADDAYSLEMTVAEFLCYRCFSLLGNYADASRDVIPFFTTSSTHPTLAQKCATLRDEAIDRVIDSASKRNQSLLLAYFLSEKANTLPYSMRMKFLVEAYDKVKGTEGEQLILSDLHDFTNENPLPGNKSAFPFSTKEYIGLLRKSVADFPKGRYVNSLKNIINDLTRPLCEIRYKDQYLTSSSIALDTKLSNCNESWVLVYDYSPFANSSIKSPKNKEIPSRCRLVKSVKVSADGTVPFNAEAKAEIGNLPKGTYVVLPSSTPDGKGIYPTILNDSWREPFTVSDISVMTLQLPDASTRVYVVNGSDGKPIEGAEVKVYSRQNYSSPRKLVKTLSTDKDGYVTISEERFEIEAFFNGSKWSKSTRYYNSHERRDTTARVHAQILADRALCHPGDSVKASVVVYSSLETEMYLNEGMTFDVVLKDANGKEVASKSVKTDRFGRTAVEFKVPDEGLLGNWQLYAYDADKKRLGSTSIQVADYIAPTFFITSEHMEEEVNPGDIVRLKGEVLTYSGMPVAGATVRYSVNYTPPLRWYAAGFATFDSSVTADEDGKYEIELPTSNLKGTQFERGVFSVQISATSPAGESQNGPSERFAIGKEFYIYAPDGGKKINITDSIAPISFFVNDMLGRKVKKELSFEMVEKSSGETVASGSFVSPLLTLPQKNYSSAVYSLQVALSEDPEVKADIQLTLWKDTDSIAPQGTKLWLPKNEVVADSNSDTVNILIGSGVSDRWIPMVLSSDGEVIQDQWIYVEKDNVSLPIEAPKGNLKYMLNLNWLSDLESETQNISILPASSEEKLQVSTESFRDKISAGDEERWSFRFFRKSSTASDIPAMAVMTDAALNAITPFKWNFSPRPNRYDSFIFMNGVYVTDSYMNVNLRKNNYLHYSVLSMPIINDYNQGWGLNGGMYYDENGIATYVGEIKNEMKLMRSAAVMKEAAPVMNAMATADYGADVMEDAIEAEEAQSEGVMVRGTGGNSGLSENQGKPELRETECPVAFFMPNLISDKDGVVNVDFIVPNFNTTWAFQLIGYDKELQTSKIAIEAVASKPIMISTHAPRFVRTGDVIQLTATVFNNSDASCSPKCRFELVDLISGKTIESKDFTPGPIEPTANALLLMPWKVPSNVSSVGFRAYAETSMHRDGEQALVPVLPASSPVVESTPFWIAPETETLEVKLPKFKDKDQVTLQYCDNPAWYCITALPDIVKPDSKSVTSKMRALYGNTIAYNLISSDINLKRGLAEMLSDQNSQFAALKSNLEKDGNLKITQLNNTPWVNNAESETLRMSRLESLLNDEDAQKTINEILDDIRALQDSDGGWSWCPDMKSSAYITQDMLRHFSMIMKAGAMKQLKDSENMVRSAIRYVDSETVKDYHKYHKKGESLSYLLDWLYIRSSFPSSYISSGIKGSEMSSIAGKARKDIASEWKEMGIGSKAKAAVVLWRAGDHSTANEILESLRQLSSETPEKGMWFDNLSSGWGGMSVLQTTTLVLEAFAEIQPTNKIIDSLRQWLVLGRQYQDWGKRTSTVETVNAILTSGTDWLSKQDSGEVEFYLKGKKLTLPASAKLTGAFTMTLNSAEASKKTLTVSRKGTSPAWGGVISQYESPILDVVATEVPDLSIRKSIVALEEGMNGELVAKEGITLRKGMKVRVTLFITAGRDMDYVAVTDERSACLEPTVQLSGYTSSDRIGYYKEVRDANTNLFFGWLPKGTHVVSYDCTVSQEGTFSCGIATAQSQYSPLTVAHSAGTTLEVK